jgi:hypothetical protein
MLASMATDGSDWQLATLPLFHIHEREEKEYLMEGGFGQVMVPY